MDFRKIGELLSDWIDEEWYIGFFVIFSVIFIFLMIKMAKEINSPKRFPKPKNSQNKNSS